MQQEIQDEPLTDVTGWLLFYNLEIQQEKMEVNEVDISGSWKKILNFKEPKLHKGVFNYASTSSPHPKRLKQFCLFNKL